MLAPNEPGLGGFELKLLDQAGNFGDSTGQITYDMFNMPVSNALAGTIDPVTGLDACPDRKSTRLNSSHLVISYAVFCLKKKKTNTLISSFMTIISAMWTSHQYDSLSA